MPPPVDVGGVRVVNSSVRGSESAASDSDSRTIGSGFDRSTALRLEFMENDLASTLV